MDIASPRTPNSKSTYFKGQFDSPQLIGDFLDALCPLAQSTAIKPTQSGVNATYTVVRNSGAVPSPTIFESASTRNASLNVLDLDSLPTNLLSMSSSVPKASSFTPLSPNNPEEYKEEGEPVDICLNADELRHLEEAFSDLSTGVRNTGAIATTTADRGGNGLTPQCRDDATNVSSMSSFSSDECNGETKVQNTEGKEIEGQAACVDENQPLFGEISETPTTPQTIAAPETYFYGRPLSTIIECRSRESFTCTSGYQGKSEIFDGGDFGGVDDTPIKSSSLVCVSRLPVNSIHHSMSESAKSGICQSPIGSRNQDFPLSSRKPLSIMQFNAPSSAQRETEPQISSLFNNENEEACVSLPAQLLSPPSSSVNSSQKTAIADAEVSCKYEDESTRDQVGFLSESATRSDKQITSEPSHVYGESYPSSRVQSPSTEITPMNHQATKSKETDPLPEPQVPPIPAPRTFKCLSNSALVPPLDFSSLALANSSSSGQPAGGSAEQHHYFTPTTRNNQVTETSTDVSAVTAPKMLEGLEDLSQVEAKICCEVDLGTLTTPNASANLPDKSRETYDGALGKRTIEELSYNLEGERSLASASHKAHEPTETSNTKTRCPLLASSRCLFWRAGTYGHESKQQFILRQDSDNFMKVRLRITSGADCFTLLDHRGRPAPNGSRLIELPPRLACSVTVVYKPNPPFFWHAGALSLRLVPPESAVKSNKSHYYWQRLIGYVAGSIVQCDICRRVDETTFWTSAFSSPNTVDRPLYLKNVETNDASYYAHVSINNIGLRMAWVFAVAMRPNSDRRSSLTPLPGVSVKPSRFVLRPSQSQDVIISISGEPSEVQVLFYNGDEILRHQCRKQFASAGQPVEAPSETLPRPHRRLRSAYVLRPFDGEIDDMTDELPPSIPANLYNWQAALHEEQSTRTPLSLTVYPLLAEAAKSSFEASSSLGICEQMENAKRGSDGNCGLTSSLATTDQIQWPSYESDALSGNGALSTSFRDNSNLAPIDNWTPNADRCMAISPPSSPPRIHLQPDSQLIFAPCRPGLFTSATLQVRLLPPDNSNVEGKTTAEVPSARKRLASLWRLYWRASPLNGTDDSPFAHLISPCALLTAVGRTHHLPFKFRPPRDVKAQTHFSQEWVLSFRLTREVNGPVASLPKDPSTYGQTQEFQITFMGDAIDTSDFHQPIITKLLKTRGHPAIFTVDQKQREVLCCFLLF
uniref:SHR-BD domain-containing protein n=1 Tax=Mesocestoides corti TaxID=53468 RepID=A0A5K3FM46_MESCO